MALATPTRLGKPRPLLARLGLPQGSRRGGCLEPSARPASAETEEAFPSKRRARRARRRLGERKARRPAASISGRLPLSGSSSAFRPNSASSQTGRGSFGIPLPRETVSPRAAPSSSTDPQPTVRPSKGFQEAAARPRQALRSPLRPPPCSEMRGQTRAWAPGPKLL